MEMFDMMVLRSSAFEDRQPIPPKYAKKGENVSPPLSWENAPQGTKSFALSIVDKLSLTRYYVHWLVCDIGADVTSLKEGASGDARMPAGSKELKAYVGPFPPSGTHNYEFTLYALKTEKLALPENVSLETFTKAVEQNGLATAKLVGTFTQGKTK
jgi:Raf kinase inhibitor-like YbhB/YbcL family protein